MKKKQWILPANQEQQIDDLCMFFWLSNKPLVQFHRLCQIKSDAWLTSNNYSFGTQFSSGPNNRFSTSQGQLNSYPAFWLRSRDSEIVVPIFLFYFFVFASIFCRLIRLLWNYNSNKWASGRSVTPNHIEASPVQISPLSPVGSRTWPPIQMGQRDGKEMATAARRSSVIVNINWLGSRKPIASAKLIFH